MQQTALGRVLSLSQVRMTESEHFDVPEHGLRVETIEVLGDLAEDSDGEALAVYRRVVKETRIQGPDETTPTT